VNDALDVALRLLIVFVVFLTFPLIVGQTEHKVMAHMQGRLGPMYAGGFHGWAQLVADGVKFAQKEDIVPTGADRRIFQLAPAVALLPYLLVLLAIPIGPSEGAVGQVLDAGIFFVLAVMGVSVLGSLMAGWASANKFSLLGGLRTAAQLLAYELPMLLTAASVAMAAGTVSLPGIVDAFHWWSPFRALPPRRVRRNRRPVRPDHRPLPGRLARPVGRGRPRLGVDPAEERDPRLRGHLAPRHLSPPARGPAPEALLDPPRPPLPRSDRPHRRREGGVPLMAPIPGSGLAKGLAVTLRTMTKKTVTEQYPDTQPDLPPRTRGVIGLFEENCTVCMLCARECPDWCIYIDSHKETVPAAAPGGRERSRNVLDRFAIDFSLCMYCGICIEVCPFDALFWSPEFEYAETDIHELTHERDKLREWMWTVPAPPALDPGAEEPKEIAAARKTAEKLAAAQAAEAAQVAQLAEVAEAGEAAPATEVTEAAQTKPAEVTQVEPVDPTEPPEGQS
jgi:NADH-quinone oxidoreductase subunit I